MRYMKYLLLLLFAIGLSTGYGQKMSNSRSVKDKAAIEKQQQETLFKSLVRDMMDAYNEGRYLQVAQYYPDLRDPDIGWLSLDPATIVMCFDTGCGSTWPPGSAQRGYIGLEFELADGDHYGYFDVNVSGSSPGIGIYGWGYETQAGAPIIAGAVPEPSSFMLVAAGAIAIFLSRRKKRIR